MKPFHFLALLCLAGLMAIGCAENDGSPRPGTLDRTFCGNGMTDFDRGSSDYAFSLALQADGKAVVVGHTFDGTTTDGALLRYDTDGSLDATFGTNGLQTFNVGTDTGGLDVAIQADGKILALANCANYNIWLFRFNTDGSLDTTYGTGGKSTNVGGWQDQPISLALQADGKALVAGTSNDGTNVDIFLYRFNTDGSLDTSFGTFGMVTYDSGSADVTAAMEVQADGKVLVAGSIYLGVGFSDIALLRFNSDGSLDPTFGTNGVVTHDCGSNDFARDVVLQADGKAVVAGEINTLATYDIVLLRFNTDGSLDTSFGTNGMTTYDGGPYEYCRAVALQADGKVLVGGCTYVDTDGNILLLRFNPDGSLDTAYGTSGAAGCNFGEDDFCADLAVQGDGKALVAGYYGNFPDENILLVRFN